MATANPYLESLYRQLGASAVSRQDAPAARQNMHQHLTDSQKCLQRAYEAQGED